VTVRCERRAGAGSGRRVECVEGVWGVPGPYVDDVRCRDFAASLERMLAGWKWSGAELARRCHFGAGVISNIVAFHRAPTVSQGEALDLAFGVTDVFAAKARVIRERADSDGELSALGGGWARSSFGEPGRGA